MATRTIVTSQPDVACDVCARRLLRGEQPDVFVAAGRRRIVCELCAPRAAHEGWLRETDSQPLKLAPMRSRRGRSLFERLRQVAKPPGDARAGLGTGSPGEREDGPYDVLTDPALADAEPGLAGRAGRVRAQPVAAAPSYAETDEPRFPLADVGEVDAIVAAPLEAEPPAQARSETHIAYEQPSEYVQQAIAVFNASEFPRRVAGVTRSLGAPLVSVRSAEHLSSVVSIVVAWELCWYRYEVDLSEPAAEAQVIAQGTELGELAREDRIGNAAAAESGTLAL